jgi:hypothetical protein
MADRAPDKAILVLPSTEEPDSAAENSFRLSAANRYHVAVKFAPQGLPNGYESGPAYLQATFTEAPAESKGQKHQQRAPLEEAAPPILLARLLQSSHRPARVIPKPGRAATHSDGNRLKEGPSDPLKLLQAATQHHLTGKFPACSAPTDYEKGGDAC